MRTYLIAGLAMTAAFAATPAFAKDVIVQMKNQGAAGAMVFEPAFVQAMPGDTVKFVPTDKSHSAQTIAAMLPAGVAPVIGKPNQEMSIKVDKPGIYGIECKPHTSMGMVALIQVGKGPSANLGAARAVKLPPLAAKRMNPMLAKAR